MTIVHRQKQEKEPKQLNEVRNVFTLQYYLFTSKKELAFGDKKWNLSRIVS